jgi:hypothetical protein
VDYAALLALVALAFAGAGAAAGLGAVPARLLDVVRTGICIAGGDVCRTVDARAEGLSPCILDERARGRGLTFTLASVHLGETGDWTVARRSDGSVLVTQVADRRAGVAGGIGAAIGSAQIGASASLDLTSASGRSWELPTPAAAARFLAAVQAGRVESYPPTWRFGDLGEAAAGQVAVSGLGLSVTVLEASARAAAGQRSGRGETTTYIHAGAALSTVMDLITPLGEAARGSSSGPAGGRSGPLLLALTRDGDGLRELTLRRVETVRGGTPRILETVGRLDLRDPANRAAVAPLLSRRLPWPPDVVAELRAAVQRTLRYGTVERSVYAVSDGSRSTSVAVRLGAELGLNVERIDIRRRLVAASAWTRGSPERLRVDCLPEPRSAA